MTNHFTPPASASRHAPDVRNAKQRLIADTLEFWQPRTRRTLTPEDARQIAENAVGFFDLLHKWDAEEKAARSDTAKGDRDASRN